MVARRPAAVAVIVGVEVGVAVTGWVVNVDLAVVNVRVRTGLYTAGVRVVAVLDLNILVEVVVVLVDAVVVAAVVVAAVVVAAVVLPTNLH